MTKRAETIDKRRRSYQAVFEGEHGKEVMKDLSVFCMSTKSTFDSDPLKMAFKEGRREVYLRIAGYLNITDDDIWHMFNREKE